MPIVNKESKLLNQLFESLTDISHSKIKQFLRNGRILVNGKTITQFDFLLHPGDKIEIGTGANVRTELNNKYLRLVYEDHFLVVIEKREGILSMATSHHSFCVKNVLDNYFERSHQRCRAHLVHRLDRDTSGLMIFAKNRNVQQLFEADWKGIVYDRRYIAVAQGSIAQQEGTISNWLKDNKQYFTYSSDVDNGGKWAVTHFRTLQRGKTNTLVELRLETGRKNQIRVHLSDLQHPVLGDRKYGGTVDAELSGSQPVSRLCLHAYRLHFIHPITGEDMRFDLPVPKQFYSYLDL